MKKISLVLLSCALMVCAPSLAQMGKGKIILSVGSTLNLPTGSGSNLLSLGYSKSKISGSSSSNTFNFNLIPRIGYFVTNNLAAGISLQLNITSDKDKGNDFKSTGTTVGAGPFVRYYLPGKTIYPFVEASAGFGSAKLKYRYGTTSLEETFNIFIFGAGAGIAVPVGEKASMDFMAGYSHVTQKGKSDDQNYSYTIAGVGLNISFVFILGGKKE
jgi:hypothetical protein